METRIQLVRHGPSAHVDDGRWLSSAEVDRWVIDYDAAGIVADDSPPASVLADAQRADVVAASDLRRGIESAERLAPGRDLLVSPLLRELSVDFPRWLRMRLPMVFWDAVSHTQWTYRLLRRNAVSRRELARATEAANWLGDAARGCERVLVVTHGGFRRLLAIQLVATGWKAESGRRGYENWSVWSFRRRRDQPDNA